MSVAETFDLDRGVIRRARRNRFLGRLGVALLMVGIAFLLLYPILMLIAGIFRSAPPGQGGEWTLSELEAALGEPRTYAALKNSLIYAVGTTALATLLGAIFAFLTTRTEVRLRRLITPVMLVVLILPTLMYAISWSLLANPNVGILNEPFKWLFDTAPLNAQSWPGLIGVQAMKLSSFAYFMLLGPFSTMNRSYEEAAMTSGASRLRSVISVDLPILTPAIAGVVIILAVFGIGAFDIPQILGSPADIDTLATRMYQFIVGQTPPRYAAASALALFMVLALIILVVFQRFVMKGHDYVTVTGKSYRMDRWDIGRWGIPATAFIVFFSLVALLLPAVQIVLTALQPTVGVMENLSFDNFTRVLEDPRVPGAFSLTLYLGLGAGLAAMLIATVVAFVGRRQAGRIQRFLDFATVAPIVMPGVVLAVGLLWAYITFPVLKQLYGTVWLCAIGMVVVVMPVASRAAIAAISQISPELEEAAATAGSSPAGVLRRVIAPLVTGSFVSGWLVCGVIIVGVLDVPLLLLPATDPNVATLVYGTINSAGLPSLAAAMLVLLMLLILLVGLVYVLAMRFLVPFGRRIGGRQRGLASAAGMPLGGRADGG